MFRIILFLFIMKNSSNNTPKVEKVNRSECKNRATNDETLHYTVRKRIKLRGCRNSKINDFIEKTFFEITHLINYYGILILTEI